MKEIQIGDEDWDKQVYIMGDSPSIKELFAKYPRIKEASLDLIQRNIKIDIHWNYLNLGLEAVPYEEVKSVCADVAPELGKLVAAIEEAGGEQKIPGFDNSDLGFFLFTTFISCLGIAALIFSIRMTEENIYHLPGNLGFYGFVSGIFFGLLTIISWRLLKKLHSRSHLEFLLLFLIAPITFGVTGSSLFFYGNRTWDKANGFQVHAVLDRKKIYNGKGGPRFIFRYKFSVPTSIKPTVHPSSFNENVNELIYSRYEEGSLRGIRIYPGYFGQPWVVKSTLK